MPRPPALLLPGILVPAAIRFRPLLAALGDDVDAAAKELEVHTGSAPSPTYRLQDELEGIDRVADAAGVGSFHLFGHSAGGAVALAYVAARPGRIRSLALDEPASDFAPDARAEAREDARVMAEGGLGAFAARLVRPGAPVPAPQPAPAPGERASAARRRAAAVFSAALEAADIDLEAFGAFGGPVRYTYGGWSDARWERMAGRLTRAFSDIVVERIEGRSHLDPAFVAEPGRVARDLRGCWARADRGR